MPVIRSMKKAPGKVINQVNGPIHRDKKNIVKISIFTVLLVLGIMVLIIFGKNFVGKAITFDDSKDLEPGEFSVPEILGYAQKGDLIYVPVYVNFDKDVFDFSFTVRFVQDHKLSFSSVVPAEPFSSTLFIKSNTVNNKDHNVYGALFDLNVNDNELNPFPKGQTIHLLDIVLSADELTGDEGEQVRIMGGDSFIFKSIPEGEDAIIKFIDTEKRCQ